ncbi:MULTISPECIES: McrB family protein [Yersinia]|uniref:5-methylcytosine-specific restriction enzyme B n=1 Tax=Yersinia aldovae TaxID=29483 RepID=A0ABM9SU50_YERAL|nr:MULTISPECIES: AAA family ATPase [Yersinia]MCB5326454.1 AAA family ATPase [Yersinia intermedia]CNJ89516.1 5-methylcytosine-specific restriction enzyme B [Yersinia intermedia]CNL16723.1 5-methylcytosine-specific restriction enzyme B [Yersinia aldovae]
MSREQIQQLQTQNDRWNGISVFKVIFLNTGSFFEIENSSGKVHDVSFQCILQSLKDIRDNEKAKQFIIYSVEVPTRIKNIQTDDQRTFDSIETSGPVECTEWKYFEKMIRVLAGNVLSYPRAKVVAGEQSKLFFNVISRIVHIATKQEPQNLDELMPFSNQNIQAAIDFLEQVISDFTISTPPVETQASASDLAVLGKKKNTIYLGAPGTGKSYSIEQETNGATKVRTVFHPDMQYSDFVGSLRPRMVNDGEIRSIHYEFRPGPFTNAYIQAKNNKNQSVFLIIEEINRAPAAAVFGDLFQLLDPDSMYEIDIDPDMLDYINENISEQIEKLSLPANLTILATMNSSDQGVNSLDTAFKRRWAIKYMSIDYTKATPGTLTIPVQGRTCEIEWKNFAKIINERLMTLGVPEDRLLGHRFLSVNDLCDSQSAYDTLCYKLFVYLWDDVLRHGKRHSIFATESGEYVLGTFGQLVAAFSAGLPVFESSIEESLIAAATAQIADGEKQ